ncbi:MAG: hypothetical protein HYV07_34220 [Deltaproteobacteria bacterium]|nr:hypothetical protein [Deltaproteobacteria bacterium]
MSRPTSRLTALDRLTDGSLARIEANRKACAGPNGERAMVEGFGLVRQLSEISTALEAKGWDRWLVDQERVRTAKVSILAARELANLDAALASCDRAPCPPCEARREYRRTLVFVRDHPSEPIPDGYMLHDPDLDP